jgi:hypothetical protein
LPTIRSLVHLSVAIAALLFVAAQAAADSTPVGPLPSGPVTTVTTDRGSFVAVAVPRQKASSGLVWRVARPLKPAVLRQVSEADVGASVVLVFRAAAKGSISVVLALTRGESSGKAVRAVTYRVRVR